MRRSHGGRRASSRASSRSGSGPGARGGRAGAEGARQPVGIGARVHQEPRAAVALQEDRITLPDIEDGESEATVGPGRGAERDRGDGGGGPARGRAATAAAPTGRAGATSGATRRFASGATNETRPKAKRTIGSVAACAASETPSDSHSQAGTPAGRGCRRASVSGPPQARSPALALP